MAKVTTLARWNRIKTELAAAVSIDEVKSVRDKAEALRLYAKQAGETLEVQNNVAEIKIRAERRAGELLANMDRHPPGPSKQDQSQRGTEPPTLSELGIDRKQSSRWQQVAALPEKRFEKHIAETKASGDELTSASVLRESRKAARPELRKKAIADLSKGDKAAVVLCDPPWRYEFSLTTTRNIENQYPTMTLDEICALGEQLNERCFPDALLFLWVPSPKVPQGIVVLKAWGFEYKTCAIWDKGTIGMGYYFRQQHELLFVAARGKPLVPPESDRPSSVLKYKRGKHSEKPEAVYVLLETWYPEVNKLEMFQRQPRKGWMGWGDQA